MSCHKDSKHSLAQDLRSRVEKEYPTSGYDKAIDDFVESLGFEKYSTSSSWLRSTLALCNFHLQNLKKREAWEIVLWGKALLETQGEITCFEKEKQDEINNALEEKLLSS